MAEDTTSERIRVEAVRGASPGGAWSFAVGRGGAVWIPDGEDSGLAWVDWVTGIEAPPEGEVCWKGVEWRERGPREASGERGRMGCVFASGGVIANLDMDENVWLPARMHRWEGAGESIERWARFFGVWPLPQERAPMVKDRDRRRILWARAFAGEPEALVLERPLRDAPGEDRARLLEAVRAARAGGCAVVWIDEELGAEARAALEPVARAAPGTT